MWLQVVFLQVHDLNQRCPPLAPCLYPTRLRPLFEIGNHNFEAGIIGHHREALFPWWCWMDCAKRTDFSDASIMECERTRGGPSLCASIVSEKGSTGERCGRRIGELARVLFTGEATAPLATESSSSRLCWLHSETLAESERISEGCTCPGKSRFFEKYHEGLSVRVLATRRSAALLTLCPSVSFDSRLLSNADLLSLPPRGTERLENCPPTLPSFKLLATDSPSVLCSKDSKEGFRVGLAFVPSCECLGWLTESSHLVGWAGYSQAMNSSKQN